MPALTLVQPEYVVYVKRITGYSGQTPLGFLVACFGPYPSLVDATQASQRIRQNHERFQHADYHVGTMQLHTGE